MTYETKMMLSALLPALATIPLAAGTWGLMGSGIGGWVHHLRTDPNSPERENFDKALKTGFLIGALGGGGLATLGLLGRILF